VPLFVGRGVAGLTGISAAEWREVRAAFPGLPRGAGGLAAARRLLLARLAARRLASGRWSARLEGTPPSPRPAVYVSAHLGSLQALRYTLRARRVRAATVLGPYNVARPEAERQDRLFDGRHPLDFPHVFPAARAHRLRSALAAGSLILAADLPAADGVEIPFLGGRLRLDPRPFRLARTVGVPCRPAFLTLPGGRWTLTLGDPLPAGEAAALEAYARCLEEVARRAPLDLDGIVYLNLARGRASG
jgi:predicted LPLAT superfamily acyltransferase